MPKKLKYIIIIFAIVVVIAITSLFYYQKQETFLGKNYQQIMQQMGKEEANKIISKDNEIYEAASANSDISQCSGISTEEQRDLCVKLIAIKAKNIKLCKKINAESIEEACKDRVNYELAVAANNLELCKTINENYLINSCVVRIVSRLGYSKLDCEALEEPQKDICLSYFFGENDSEDKDILVCQKENDIECLYGIFAEQDSLDFCESLEEDFKGACVQVVAKRLAFKNRDLDLCNEFITLEEREACRERINRMLDLDNDGLTDMQESAYGTDLANPDTDGDGYKDGDEVESGFNPAGEGKLEI